MCGYLDAVPMDRHAIRFLRDVAGQGVDEKYDKGRVRRNGAFTRGLRGKGYGKYEQKFSEFAQGLGITPAALQMLIYVQKTGWDGERHPFLGAA